MRRGTTPTHIFRLPFEVPESACVRIVYKQNDKIVLERTTDSCEVKGNVVTIGLTVEETLAFDCSAHRVGYRCEPYPVEIQVGIKTAEGAQLWSNIITAMPERCLRPDGAI